MKVTHLRFPGASTGALRYGAQAVFHRPGRLELPDGRWIAVNSPGIVQLKPVEGGAYALNIADPTHTLRKVELALQLHRGASGPARCVRVELPGGRYAGKTVTTTVGLP